ncbi:TRAPP II complex, Trs65 [Penicillium griseofulvum]|uniref:TRAPP II complex, Trs65 n=1 Tax=Penicillium patulum TaxID=5078 RepID=A0A135L9M9_PENPA|nr:TRAPP II complex, Trs65 [Penicillium griseofulvum]KXG45661.1 TRAPP II complex, Trs65 [Penicillium griseofulvum]
MPGLEIPGEFLRHAILDTVVPHAPALDIEGALSSALEDGADDLPSVLSSIPQRSLLFFETTLKHYLPRLELKLDVFAVDPAESVGENTTPTRDIIFSGVVSGEEDPLVVFNEFEGDEGSGNHVYLVWNIETILRRPRIRIQHPSLLFIASASLNPADGRRQEDSEDDYLPSLVPASTNMLQSLSIDKSFNHKEPFLPASRLLRVVPTTYNEDPIYNIQQQHGHPFRVVPAASARIRYSRLSSYTGIPMTVASLDFEVTPYLTCEVSFDKANLQLSEGTIESLSDTPGLTLPISCRPRDDVTLMYKLTPEYGPETNPSSTALVSTLDIALEAIILVDDDCKPRISMQWRTNVDFSVALNPTYGGPSPALQRTNRPTSLSVSTQVGVTPSHRSSLRERAYSVTDVGITISFSGPVRVQVGSVFTWHVFIVNRSNVPRKFALIAIPKRKRVDPRGHVARPSSSSIASRKEDQVAEAVTDDNIVHARQKSVAGQEVELISLSTDIRVGPLLPGTCHSTELKLLPLATGPLHLEAVRLVDVNTNETTDIRDLPDILADDQPRSS